VTEDCKRKEESRKWRKINCFINKYCVRGKWLWVGECIGTELRVMVDGLLEREFLPLFLIFTFQDNWKG